MHLDPGPVFWVLKMSSIFQNLTTETFYINILLIFILFAIFVEKRVGIKKVSLVKFFNILDIVITAKTGPRSKMIDRVQYFGCLIQINKSHKKSFYQFLRRPYNDHTLQFSC